MAENRHPVLLTPETGEEERAERSNPFNPLGRLADRGGALEPDLGEEIRDNAIARELASSRNSFRPTVHHIPRVGNVVIPRSNSYLAHKNIYDSNLYDIKFSTYAYELFDKVVSDTFGKDAFVNPKHYHAEDYDMLKRNIAIVRNYIYAGYFPDGEYNTDDPEDVANAAKLPEIATKLGKALKMGHIPIVGNALAKGIYGLDVEAAGKKGGAELIYKALLQVQGRPTLANPTSWTGSKPGHNWDLPPLEDSPFSEENMFTNQLNFNPWTPEGTKSKSEELLAVAFHLDNIATRLKRPENLPQPVLDESIDYARKILDNFRIAQGEGMDGTALANNSNNDEDQVGRLYDMALMYQDYVSSIAKTRPDLLSAPVFEETRHAIRQVAYDIKVKAAEQMIKEGRTDSAQVMTELIGKAPVSVKKGEDNFRKLSEKLEAGLEAAAKIKGQQPRRGAARVQVRTQEAGLSQGQKQAIRLEEQRYARERIEIEALKKAQREARFAGRDVTTLMSDPRVTKANSQQARALARRINETELQKQQRQQQQEQDQLGFTPRGAGR